MSFRISSLFLLLNSEAHFKRLLICWYSVFSVCCLLKRLENEGKITIRRNKIIVENPK